MLRPITNETARVYDVFRVDPKGVHYGYQLMDLAELDSGTVYPMLRRLKQRGWLVSSREEGNPVELGRPLRTEYRLTEVGISEVLRALMAYEEWGREQRRLAPQVAVMAWHAEQKVLARRWRRGRNRGRADLLMDLEDIKAGDALVPRRPLWV
jgi:PadR family transcriptional regulator, regulatory protein PadR